MPRRTSRGAIVVAAIERNIEVLFANMDPRLIGWTALAEPVWEVTLDLDKRDGADPKPMRMPFTESALLEWAGNGREGSPPLGEVEFGPPIAERAPGFYLPPEPGWKYMRCVTYDPPPEQA